MKNDQLERCQQCRPFRPKTQTLNTHHIPSLPCYLRPPIINDTQPISSFSHYNNIESMALFLQFQDHLQRAQRQLLRRTGQNAPKPDVNIPELLRVLEMVDVAPQLESKHLSCTEFSIRFVLKLSYGFSALYRLSFQARKKEAKVEVKVLEHGKLCCVKSSEILRNICRTVRSINSMAGKSPFFFMLGPKTGQLLVRTQENYTYNHPQKLFGYLRTSIAQSYNFLKTFSTLLLYSCNLMPRSSIESELMPALRPMFYGPGGELQRYAEIYQMLPLINCPLEPEENNEEELSQKNSNPKKILQLYYDQRDNAKMKELQLYAEPALFLPEKQVGSFKKSALNLSFPTPKENAQDRSHIFNTVTVVSHDKKRERFMAEGGRARVIASPTRFFYAKSMNPLNQQVAYAKKDRADESTQETQDADAKDQNTVQLQKVMLVKLPRVSPKDKQWKKAIQQIRYQKSILCNFRSVGSGYLPKYYHTIQSDYQYRSFLLMDYIPGNTLTQEMDLKEQTFTHSAKLHILSHLSNAIRFLESYQVAHLDLTPSNIIVVKDFLIKLIDFGEAYHKNTSSKFSLAQGRGQHGKFIYSPGRTFPYAPPETSLRLDSFTSQQDIYSLGVIMHQLIFGTFPFTCSQETHKKLYQDKSYMGRVMLAPERGDYYGQSDYLAVVMNLVLKLMDGDERRRPSPTWAHIIIKKLFYTIR